ncbi:GNAT family N-acetyltransferase [Paenibacillus caseinilyticus]|uniref:Acetyltransferase n=1 Tax=Paenibacillus mucilaginosus K02 TaxID=997761 RepID=I0BLQ0_9BACL|nr:GNAT family N-acetyltransferase [Paenibacillus mucilaginosus]AFH63297.1 acetyltransferase [Paenibacillus mucilaginosus K02]
MTASAKIELTHWTPRYAEALDAFELPAEQLQFTALPKDALSQAADQHPIVILSEGTPVGFFVLHSSERVHEYSANPRAMLLAALSVDRRQQGKGYAKLGMLALPGWIRTHFPNCNEVVLAVNHKNRPARQLYWTACFADTGRRRMGPNGEQWIMSRKW